MNWLTFEFVIGLWVGFLVAVGIGIGIAIRQVDRINILKLAVEVKKDDLVEAHQHAKILLDRVTRLCRFVYHMQKWRRDAWEYDDDMGYEHRCFDDEEEWDKVEEFAKGVLDADRESHLEWLEWKKQHRVKPDPELVNIEERF